MERKITKQEFKSTVLKELNAGDVLIVECGTYNEMNSARSLAVLAWKRYKDEYIKKGVCGINTHAENDNTIIINII